MKICEKSKSFDIFLNNRNFFYFFPLITQLSLVFTFNSFFLFALTEFRSAKWIIKTRKKRKRKIQTLSSFLLINHRSQLIAHHSSLTTHRSSLTTHRSSLIAHHHHSPLITHNGTGFQPAVVCVTIIRRQMLTHFPTVTQSTGFQPEPLLITLCSLLKLETWNLKPSETFCNGSPRG